MSAASPLQVILLVAIACAGAVGGFIACAVTLRKKRRARGYFVIGVLTGLMAAAIGRRRSRRLVVVAARLRRRLQHGGQPAYFQMRNAAIGLSRSLSQSGLGSSVAFRLRSHGQVIRAHTMRTIATSANK
jgi:hypothetical protein